DLVLLRGPDPALGEDVLDLEEGEGDAEDHRPQHHQRDELGDQLAAAVAAVEDAGDTLGLAVDDVGGGAVPADARAAGVDAVLAVGEDADEEHAEAAAHAVHRDGADRIIDL